MTQNNSCIRYLGQFERGIRIVPHRVEAVVDGKPDGIVLKDPLPIQRLQDLHRNLWGRKKTQDREKERMEKKNELIQAFHEKQGPFGNIYWLPAINKLVMKRLAYKTPLYRIKI